MMTPVLGGVRLLFLCGLLLQVSPVVETRRVTSNLHETRREEAAESSKGVWLDFARGRYFLTALRSGASRESDFSSKDGKPDYFRLRDFPDETLVVDGFVAPTQLVASFWRYHEDSARGEAELACRVLLPGDVHRRSKPLQDILAGAAAGAETGPGWQPKPGTGAEMKCSGTYSYEHHGLFGGKSASPRQVTMWVQAVTENDEGASKSRVMRVEERDESGKVVYDSFEEKSD